VTADEKLTAFLELKRITSDGFKGCSPAFRAWGSRFGQRRTSKMLYVPATGAFPGKGPFSARLFDLPENRVSLVANRPDRAYQRVERRVHKFNSIC
jgi:hypothetical protein